MSWGIYLSPEERKILKRKEPPIVWFYYYNYQTGENYFINDKGERKP